MDYVRVLTDHLNSCKNRRKIFNLVKAISTEPSVQHVEDPAEKFEVLFSQLSSVSNETHGD